jgi:hypothetical protein
VRSHIGERLVRFHGDVITGKILRVDGGAWI